MALLENGASACNDDLISKPFLFHYCTDDLQHGVIMISKKHVLVNLQIARLAAALLVVVHHALHEMIDNRIVGAERLDFTRGFDGSLGVDIFFVISGFIMMMTTGDRFGRAGQAKTFIRRRLARIVPLYWVFTGAMLAALLFLPGRVSHSVPDIWMFIASLLFIPAYDTAGLIQPVLGVGWTLNYEMLFYLVFAIALLLPRRIGLPLIFATLLGFVAIGLILPAGAPAPLLFWFSPLLVEFLFGITLGLMLEAGIRLDKSIAFMLAIFGMFMLWVSSVTGWTAMPSIRWFVGGLPAAMIIAACALGPQFGQITVVRLLRLGGDASYALYLSHPFAINIAAVVWRHLSGAGALGFIVVATLVSLVVGVLAHLLLERPLLDILHRRPIAMMDHPLLLRLRSHP